MFAISSSILLISLAISGELLLEREFRREQETTLDDTVALLQSLCRQESNLADLTKHEIPRELQALHFHVYHVKIEDESGRIYTRNTEAENLMPTAQIQLNQDIKGRETIEKEIVFDVSEPAKDLKLLITEGYGIDKVIEAVLVGDEDSVLHQKTVFKIEPQSQMANLQKGE